MYKFHCIVYTYPVLLSTMSRVKQRPDPGAGSILQFSSILVVQLLCTSTSLSVTTPPGNRGVGVVGSLGGVVMTVAVNSGLAGAGVA